MTNYLLSSLLLLSVFSPALTSIEDLLLVQVVFRHGDRTPIKPYPKDPYQNLDQWPVGFGELTPIGKRAHYGLGKLFRQRYQGFLSDKFRATDIYVRSTDVDRTLMSAEANLAGLYPPLDDQVWNPDLLWQPIPVHTVPVPEDSLLSMGSICPRADALVKDLIKTDPTLKSLDEDNAWLYKYLTNHTGQDVSNLTSVGYIYDTLNIERRYNKTLPPWTDAVFPDMMQRTFNISFALLTWNDELKRLRSGTLIQKLINNSHDKLENKTQYRFHMFSGHDTTVSGLLNSLRLFDPPIPPSYAATVFIELYRNNGTHALKFTYRNDSGEHLLTVPGCQVLCPLGDFERLTAKIRPKNVKAECFLEDSTVNLITMMSIVISSILALILVASVTYAVCIKIKKGSQDDLRYFSIQQEY